MKKTDFMKEMIIVKKLRAEDPVDLPMDEMFFEKLHGNIMKSIEKTEVKPVNKWTKTWVFLERKTGGQKNLLKKAVKLGVTAATFSLGLGVLSVSFSFLRHVKQVQIEQRQNSVAYEAQRNPIAWSELAFNYENENDFYSDILSQRSSETMVEIDQIIVSAL